MDNQYEASFIRNQGIFSSDEQEKIKDSKIAIAGLGGIGGLTAERLIRLGVGKLNITDPGNFEYSNINRQFASTVDNIGQNKADVIFQHIKNINPQAIISYDKTGIRQGIDMHPFLDECKVVVDAMDYGMYKESILLQRAAREMGIYYLFAAAMGFGAITVVFNPSGITLEEYDDLSPGIDLANTQIDVPLEKIMPIIPGYVQDKEFLRDIFMGKIPVPTCSIGAGLAAIQAASEVVNIIIGKNIPEAPKYTYLDLVDRKMIVDTIR